MIEAASNRPRQAQPWGIRTFNNPGFVTVVLVMVATLSVLALLADSLSLSLVDFSAYYQGGSDWVRGLDPYHVYLGTHLDVPAGFRGGFIYPPYTLPFFGALASLGYQWEARLWVAAELAALAAIIWFVAGERRPRQLAGCTILVLVFLPTVTSVAFGQLGLMVLAAAVVAFELHRRGHDRGAGVALACAALAKFFPLAAAAVFLVRGRLMAAISAGATMATVAVVTWPLTSRLWPEYVGGILLAKSQPALHPGNQSLAAAVARVLPASRAAEILELVLPALLLAAVLAVVWVVRKGDERLSYALLLATLPLVVPNGLQHYFVFALPLLWLLLREGLQPARRWLLGAVVIAELGLSVVPATIASWAPWGPSMPPGLFGLLANSSVVAGLMLLAAGARLVLSGSDRPPA